MYLVESQTCRPIITVRSFTYFSHQGQIQDFFQIQD